MKILLGVGIAFRIALLCLIGGFALGLYVGSRPAGEAIPASGAAAPVSAESDTALLPRPGKEVPQWRPTPSF